MFSRGTRSAARSTERGSMLVTLMIVVAAIGIASVATTRSLAGAFRIAKANDRKQELSILRRYVESQTSCDTQALLNPDLCNPNSSSNPTSLHIQVGNYTVLIACSDSKDKALAVTAKSKSLQEDIPLFAEGISCE